MLDSQLNKIESREMGAFHSLTNYIISGGDCHNLIILNLIFGHPKQFIVNLFGSRNTDRWCREEKKIKSDVNALK